MSSLLSSRPSALFPPAFTLKLDDHGHRTDVLGGRALILIFPFLVQHVTGAHWSEVGEEGNMGMGRGGGIWAAVPGCLREH